MDKRPEPRRAAVGSFLGRDFYLFGGTTGGNRDNANIKNDFWKYDVQGWNKINQSEESPCARRYPGICSDEQNLYLFGGCSQDSTLDVNSFLNDVWKYNPDTGWSMLKKHSSQPSPELPMGRYTPAMDIFNGKLYIFGGWRREKKEPRKRQWLNDFWKFDISTQEWENLNPNRKLHNYSRTAEYPANRYGHKAIISDKNFWLFGGHGDFDDHNDFWRFDLIEKDWELIHPSTNREGFPSGRYQHTFVEINGSFYLYGGRSRQHPHTVFSDLWKYNPDKNKWSQIDTSRSLANKAEGMLGPGYIGKCAYGVLDEELYIFTGESYSSATNQLQLHNAIWKVNPEDTTWKKLSSEESLFTLSEM